MLGDAVQINLAVAATRDEMLGQETETLDIRNKWWHAVHRSRDVFRQAEVCDYSVDEKGKATTLGSITLPRSGKRKGITLPRESLLIYETV